MSRLVLPPNGALARCRFAGDVIALPRTLPPLRCFQMIAQHPARPVAAGRRWSFHLRSPQKKCTTRRTLADHFRRKECEAQAQPISSVPMKKVVPRRIARFCVTALTSQFFVIFAHAQNVGIGTFSDLVGKTLEQAPSPTPQPESVIVRREFGKPVVEVSACPIPFFSAPTAGWEYDYRIIQRTDVQGLRFDVNEAHASFNFTLASTTTVSLDYFHVWSDGSNDASVSQTSDANGVRAIFQRTIGDHLIFALPFVFQEENAAGSSVIGPNSSTADTYVFNPFVLFKTPLKITKQPLIFSMSSGYRVVVINNGDIHPIAPDIDGWNGTFSALARLDYIPNKNVDLSGSATWSHLTHFYLSTVAPRPDDNTFALGASATFSFGQKPAPCPQGQSRPRFTLTISYQYDGFNRDYYSHSFTAVGSYSL
jgi:hypothetical protein